MSDRQPGLARQRRVTAAVQTGSDGSSVPEDSQALHFLSWDQEIGVHTSADLLESVLGSLSCKHARCWGCLPRHQGAGSLAVLVLLLSQGREVPHPARGQAAFPSPEARAGRPTAAGLEGAQDSDHRPRAAVFMLSEAGMTRWRGRMWQRGNGGHRILERQSTEAPTPRGR